MRLKLLLASLAAGIVWAADGVYEMQDPARIAGAIAEMRQNSGMPPRPEGNSQRFVIVEGMRPDRSKAMFRMDTFTGETWVLGRAAFNTPTTPVSFDLWTRLDEWGSYSYQAFLNDAGRKRVSPPKQTKER